MKFTTSAHGAGALLQFGKPTNMTFCYIVMLGTDVQAFNKSNDEAWIALVNRVKGLLLNICIELAWATQSNKR